MRELGHSGVEVTELGLGGAAIGGLYAPVAAETAQATVARAYEAGVRYFDTAPHYGVGTSEEHMGAALQGRDGFVLSTKVGRILRPRRPGEDADLEGFVPGPDRVREWDFSADGIRRSLEDSLKRLGLDHVDVAYIHDPDDHEEEVYRTAYPALAKLRDEGVVRAIGAGMNQSAMLTRFVRRLDLDVVLCAGRYTLLEQPAAADLLPACEERGTSVVIGGVYNSGLLIDPKPGAPYDYAPAPEPVVARAREIAGICAAYGVPLPAAALAYVRRHPAVASVLVGCRSPEEVDATVAYWRTPVPDALWEELAG